MSAPPPPPGGVDMTFLYQMIVRVDDKLDRFMEQFVPRTEADSRFEALEKRVTALEGRPRFVITQALVVLGIVASIVISLTR